ncbi:MAG: glycosyltransferase family 2 protein [Hyphomonadaceae bacterium]|nr:glycosyltransferase family 2 protein [Hyphomonadaceae bacterium]
MRVCAVIVSYRTGPALGACLEALAAANGLDEIVLVDNGNAAAETAVLDAFAATHSKALVIRGHGNIGFAAACNRGARAGGGDVLAFVNPDVVLASDALPRLVVSLEAARAPAIIGGDLRDAEGRPDRGGRRERLTLWRAIVSASGLSKLERIAPIFRDFNRHTDPLPAAPVRVGAVSGALMMIRRADFEALGGFDEGYFVHVEDVDLCRRAEEAGGDVLFAPGPHGRHERSTSDATPRAVARYRAESMARYLRKFARGPLERVLTVVASSVLLAMTPKV